MTPAASRSPFISRFDWQKAAKTLPLSAFSPVALRPADRPPRLLASMAFSPTLEASFSGSTYHLARAGMLDGTLEGCFSLYSAEHPLRALQMRGALWKLARVLSHQRTSGFKFTAAYQDTVWPRYIGALAGATIVHNLQLFGPEFRRRHRALDIAAYFYIDGTLTEYFESYAEFEAAAIDPATRKHAIEVEREDYHSASGLIAMSRMTANTLRHEYNVPPEKISIVVPGSNLLDEVVDSAQIQTPELGAGDFILGFTGVYPKRKGLDKLAEAVRIMRGRKLPVRLRVIGKCPDEYRSMEGLEFAGFIGKQTSLPEFLDAIGTVHLGCLVSRSEMTGISVVEFLRLGVPVLGTKIGGLTDILEGGGSISVKPDVSAGELADVIGSLINDPDRYRTLKQQAESRRNWASWRRVARQLDALLP